MIKNKKVYKNQLTKKIKQIRKGIQSEEFIPKSKVRQLTLGFTLIEILVVIGIIALLASVVIVAINPSRQFKLARDSQRLSNVTAILNAISQNTAEHKGIFDCTNQISNTAKIIKSDNTTGIDIASCLIPNYISSIPFDPSNTNAHYIDNTDYNTEYTVSSDAQGRIIVSAIGEITPNISVTR